MSSRKQYHLVRYKTLVHVNCDASHKDFLHPSVVLLRMTISIQEAYNTLGLTRDASLVQVKKTYRKLALQFHPDKNPDPAATAKFQQLSAAYKRVDDHLKRGSSASFDDFSGAEFDEFNDENFDFNDDFGMSSMEEMLFMFDMLFGPPPQVTRPIGDHGKPKKGKKSGNGGQTGVRVNLRRRGGKRQMPHEPLGFPSYIGQEFMDMFAHGMMFDDSDFELSDFEDEFKSMASFFAHSEMNFDSDIPTWISEEKEKNKVKMEKEDETKAQDTKSAVKSNLKSAPTIGSRVCIHGKHSGVVMFTGHVHYAKGEFVGVALSSPVGKNDGSIKGVRYFECSPSHGLMVRPSDVTLAA